MPINPIVAFLLLFSIAKAETIELESKAGSTMEVELIDRSPHSVRVKFGGRYSKVRYSDLTEESVNAIKSTNIPLLTRLEIKVDVNLNREEIKQTSTGKKKGGAGRGKGKGNKGKNTAKSTTIYKVTGSAEVFNKDIAAPSPAGELYISLLSSNSANEVLSHESFPIRSLESLGETSVDLGSFTTKSVPDKTDQAKGKGAGASEDKTKTDTQGKLYGWVAAMVVERQIVAFAASGTHLDPRSRRTINLLKLNGKVDYETALD